MRRLRSRATGRAAGAVWLLAAAALAHGAADPGAPPVMVAPSAGVADAASPEIPKDERPGAGATGPAPDAPAQQDPVAPGSTSDAPPAPPATPEPAAPAGSAPMPAAAVPRLPAATQGSGAAAPAISADAVAPPAPPEALSPASPHNRAALLAAAQEGTLGRAHFAAACTPAAQRLLDAGLVLVHAGDPAAARDAFDAAAAADPPCTGAPLGRALTDWAHGGAGHLARGRAALEQARALDARSLAEAAWLESLTAYFEGDARSASVRRGALRERLRRWHEEQPEDDDIAVLYAASLLEPGAPGTTPEHARTLAAQVLARTPTHAGAARIAMLAAQLRGDVLGALHAAQAWAAAAPASARAPLARARLSARLGLYEDALHAAGEAAQRARASDTTDTAGAALGLAADAALQVCAADAAHAALDDLRALGPPAAVPAAWVEAGLALHARDWPAAANLPLPTHPPLARALVHYARALARARLAEAPDADPAEDAPQDADAATQQALGFLRLVVRAAAAAQAGESARAESFYDAAMALEAGAGGALLAPLPAVVLRGDWLLAQRRPEEALAMYETALARYPNRQAALAGAHAAALALGASARAHAYLERQAPRCREAAGLINTPGGTS